ncbi:MAG TPA: aromatic acid/H+ symport family MFS transporter [Bryobacteraceae bacterium]|nr:aromatic acid/H+ symport family MFS transporter [Bryobacteraceae bacterium]
MSAIPTRAGAGAVPLRAPGVSPLRVGVLCALAVLMDGFDAQAMGFVAPALLQQWHISRVALSPILSSGLVGMLMGALAFGPLGDRVGRKRVLLLSTLWFGAGSLLTARAGSMEAMLWLRLLTGFGLGGAMPNATALTAEYMPPRFRATGVMLMFFGFSIGAAIGGFVAAGIIGRYGWPAVFVAGGLTPLAMAVVLLALPESARFLEERKRRFPVTQLFTQRRARTTLLLWVMFFMSLLDLYFLNSWLPTVIHDAGVPLSQAIAITAMFQVGGAAAAIVLGRVVDRRQSYGVLAAVYLGAAVCVFWIGLVSATVAVETAAVFAAGFCVIGGQTCSNSLAAESYPTAIRSTGVGWALGIGRIGSIVGPVVGGVLLSFQWGTREVFLAAAIPAVIAALAAMGLNPRRQQLE